MPCPNEFPTLLDQPYKLAIIGEAPGQEEDLIGQPFVGTSGRLLVALLNNVGISRSACFLGNVCQVRPPKNELSLLPWNGPEITAGLQQLKQDLEQFNPNLCLLLGNAPLKAAKGSGYSISDWRGSVFVCDLLDSPFFKRKCLPAYHPAYCLRDYLGVAVLRFDLRTTRRESETPSLIRKSRCLLVDLPPEEVLVKLQQLLNSPQPISFDIEGRCSGAGMTCCSIATAQETFIVPFHAGSLNSFFDLEQEQLAWKLLAKVLEEPNIPKILQNAMYDRFVMFYRHGILIRNIQDDTMLKHWELYSELEKSLAFQTSIYTNEPFYKDDRGASDRRIFWTYCCKDSSITYEICHKQTAQLIPGSKDHYKFNLRMLDPMLYMEVRGIRIDLEKRQSRIQELNLTLLQQQDLLNTYSGQTLNVNSPKQMKEFLFTKLKLPVRHNKAGSLTADYTTLLELSQRHPHPALEQSIIVRQLSKRISILNSIAPDSDGRVRCSYNVVGTATGRLSCSKSPTGNGTNLQTIPKEDRDLFTSDHDHLFFQCDLSGADGWTVAAHCAALGDTTMLDDYLSGIKPAKVLSLMIKNVNIRGLTRFQLLGAMALNLNPKKNPQDDQIYFMSKCCQHGTNYGMGKILLAATIFKESEGTIRLSSSTAEQYQNLYKSRYPGLQKWHTWVAERIKKDGHLTAASGQRRLFFGRKDSHDTLKEALAHEPQANTTFVTNKAMLNLWSYMNNNPLAKVEPLHQVHDAICGQFLTITKDTILPVVRNIFDFPISIHGIELKIPFEGGCGLNWKDCYEQI